MPKINVYLPDELAAAVKEAQVPVSAICQSALERAVRDVQSVRAADQPPAEDRPGVGLFGRFTPRARAAMSNAERCAREVPHNYVGTEHVLLGVLEEGGNLALKILESSDIELDDLRAELVASLGPATERVEGHIPFTPLAKRALESTAKEALTLGHNYIGCEHLLLGLLGTDDGLASQVLRRMGLELRMTRATTVKVLVGFGHAQQNPPSATSAPPMISASQFDEILQRLVAIEDRMNDKDQ
jgi:ATP-dependent Clp protease ATP-binding subunit ClpC